MPALVRSLCTWREQQRRSLPYIRQTRLFGGSLHLPEKQILATGIYFSHGHVPMNFFLSIAVIRPMASNGTDSSTCARLNSGYIEKTRSLFWCSTVKL